MTEPIRTTCPYCGVGCGVLATPQDDGSVLIAGDPQHPANFGRLCSKGSALAETISLEGRQLVPMIDGVEASWSDALDAAAGRLRAIIDAHGPDAVALYGSGQLLTEDYYVANKLMKGFIGTANIDTNSRLCMASSVAGHKRAFGSDTVPGTYEDLELADLVVLVGSNLAWCHPVLYQRILAARDARPDLRIVVIDPRRTNCAETADLHLPIASDGDVALFAGLFAHLSNAGVLDARFIADHTTGISDALDAADDWTISRVAEATGLSTADVAMFFDMFTATERVVTVYSQGVNQSTSGTDKVNAILNCHLGTGRIGRPGMGPFSITGQPNAMGGREVGGLANMLAAHMEFDDADRVARFWNAPAIATKPGLKAVDMFDAIGDGRIKAVWIMATNPVVSLPDADAARKALADCDTVIVSDMFATTDTARMANIFLPAAGWGEKSGTVTNSERRISRQRAFRPLPGDARPDWWIICQIARRLGFSGFDYASPAEIFAEHAELSGFENRGSRDFDISALADRDYETLAPAQWPVPRSGRGATRFFGSGGFFTPDGKARILPLAPPPPKDRGPGQLILNTGRVRDHWHTMTRTGRTPRLSAHYAEPFAEIHPHDAERLSIRRTQLVRLENAYGTAIVRALVTDRQQKGSVFVPMHWTGETAVTGRANALLGPFTDPVSGQPALKMGRVSATPVDVALYGFLVSCRKPDLSTLDYWAVAPAREGWRAEIAFFERPEDILVQARAILGLPANAQLTTSLDARTGRINLVRFDGDRLDCALYLSPDPVLAARQWIIEQFAGTHDTPIARARVLAGRPGADQPDPGPLVCSCFGVGANQIADAVVGGCASVADIGDALQAGTNCGSCRTEIGRIIDANRLAAAE
ncbi:molybdopterin-dependent oxidoreductase [Pelagibacterium flavum]|uniref:Molybdopterin-dependent oxidoreductase n=1 Tax=Pelagibacterium flavum TaxID=2984530 RepID=A0ABY6IRS6_9HYPH|nr:nitrate reductase [Pelagibacterium sp. YIM 151497]UYQ73166.1 molybdopterin-dependent oxidoreductase [Pelagibacterium sp. YIM 151497]